jgi:hypothetical protein
MECWSSMARRRSWLPSASITAIHAGASFGAVWRAVNWRRNCWRTVVADAS